MVYMYLHGGARLLSGYACVLECVCVCSVEPTRAAMLLEEGVKERAFWRSL